MRRFSANTGFLFQDRPFLERFSAARAAGFDALEFHDEAQREDPARLTDALAAAGLPVLGLNLRMGATSGCAALPDCADQARRDIDAGLALAARIGAGAVHILSGRTEAAEARAAYVAALRYALGAGALTLLIEPISARAIPGYWLNSLDRARQVIEEVGSDRVKILFDTYHIATWRDDLAAAFAECAPLVGHVQIADPGSRAEPQIGGGAHDFAKLLPALELAGYRGAFGCEYRPVMDPATCLARLRQIG